MSRHSLPPKNPDHEVIVGWDRPLRHFFGQVFDLTTPPNKNDCIAGWPTRYGLGVQPKILEDQESIAMNKLNELHVWVRPYIADGYDFRRLCSSLINEFRGVVKSNI